MIRASNVAIPAPNNPMAGIGPKPLMKMWLKIILNINAANVMYMATDVFCKPSVKLFKAENKKIGMTEIAIKAK